MGNLKEKILKEEIKMYLDDMTDCKALYEEIKKLK